MSPRSNAARILYLAIGLCLLYAAVFADEAPKCAYCGEKMRGRYISSEGKDYHVRCYEEHIALRCALCGEIIKNEYYEDFWGNTVHARHKGDNPQCEYCRRFISEKISGGGVKYDDGRIICGLCREHSVDDVTYAEAVKSNLRKALKGQGIDIGKVEVPLFLVNRNTMAELSAGSHADPLGFTSFEQTTFGDGVVADRSFRIYMLSGLPRFEFISALAHELMHVWMFTNAPTDIDPVLREGSCNYAAYLIISDYPDKEAGYVVENMTSDPNPIYGEGFRQVKKYADRHGVYQWLEYLKDNKYPPW